MKEILKSVRAHLRKWGYLGSGQTYRSTLDDIIYVINFQKSRWGEQFYVNLGAQPLAILDEGEREPDPKSLKHYECVFRDRVKGEWRTDLSQTETEALVRALDETRRTFQAKVVEMRALSRRGLGREMFEGHRYTFGEAKAALILARLLAADGHPGSARSLAEHAIASGSGKATHLRAAAEQLLSELPSP